MNKIILLSLMINSVFTMSASADQLKCWKTKFKEARTPFFVADIVNNHSIRNIRFIYNKPGYKNVDSRVVGTMNTNNRSPYKGTIDYRVAENFVLTLPADLSNKNLVNIEPQGLGNKTYKNENGIIQSLANDCSDDGGWCYTYTDRLSCRSTIE